MGDDEDDSEDDASAVGAQWEACPQASDDGNVVASWKRQIAFPGSHAPSRLFGAVFPPRRHSPNLQRLPAVSAYL